MDNLLYSKRKTNYRRVDLFIISIIIIASVLGSLYGVYVNRNSLQCTSLIYIWINSGIKNIEITIMFTIWLKYFKKIFIVWICSFFKFTYVMSYVVVFCTTFSFAFTAVSLFVLIENKDVLFVLCTSTIQTLINIGICIEIINQNRIIYNQKERIVKNIRSKKLVEILILTIIMVLVDYIVLTILT